MKNSKTFKKEVEEGTHIRYEINEEHSPVMGKLGKLYKALFNRDAREFKYAKDTLYYKGGWPSENTPSRAQSLANKIADAYTVLSFIGKIGELEKYLKDRGLKVEPLLPETFEGKFILDEYDWQINSKREKVVTDTWAELFGDKIPDEPKEILKKMMDRALEKQERICELADEIKIEKGEKIEEECDIRVGNFTKTVQLSYKKFKGANISDDILKVTEDYDEKMACLEILEQSSYVEPHEPQETEETQFDDSIQ